jgi:hypothetical protein
MKSSNFETDGVEHNVIPPAAQQVVEVPASMVLQIATGMEDEYDIAERFHFDRERYDQLKTWPPFQKQIAEKRAELQAQGVTFRIQSAYMAEDLAKDVYKVAKSNEATFMQKLEAFRTFTKLADLEPKANAVASTGPAFSISIVLNKETKNVESAHVIEQGAGPADGRLEGAQLVNGVLVRPGGG